MARTDILTKKQKRLVQELDDICALISVDYRDILNYEKDDRSTYLELARNKLVRGQVIIWFTLVDEYLNMLLCRYYFGKKHDFIYLWRSKRFQLFNYHILEELHLMQKLRHVKAIRKMPRHIVQNIEKLNALRNGIAHAFFPENLRKSRPNYKGKNIFSFEGLSLLNTDMEEMYNYLLKGK